MGVSMDEQKDLHVNEEFSKAKRNLLWFCCFATLLWIVQLPPDGVLQAPMLGDSAKLDIRWLRGLTWIACLYCFVAFYRQVRNVDRVNSQALYTEEISTIARKLAGLAATFGSILDSATEIADAAKLVKFVRSSDLDAASASLIASVDEALALPDSLLSSHEFPDALESARSKIETAVHQKIRDIKQAEAANSAELAGIASLMSRGDSIITSVLDLRGEFHRLSNQIRSEHRLLYTWYDKYLSYGMFALATVASGWEWFRAAGSDVHAYIEAAPILQLIAALLALLAAIGGAVISIRSLREARAAKTRELTRDVFESVFGSRRDRGT